jgi:16S rRNA A1518/A1519 N6-dimethyltransferase RsmA/KsgA/DIM1 with predicted DNA glycosylase/AP lyase activity
VAGDAYEVSGEFIDVLNGPAWETLREPVRVALHGAASQEGPIVEVGAGSGLGTRVVADACPAATILAVEPSPVLRAVLLSRVVSDADLRERVTVVAADALGVDLPDRLGGVVAINMIGHLDREERRTF